MFKRQRRAYEGLERVIIGADFHTEGGSWRSIFRYYSKRKTEGRSIRMIDRRRRQTLRQIVAAWAWAPRGTLLVNSLNSLHYWDVLLLCLFRSDVALYLHETEHSLNAFKEETPLKFAILKRILKRNRILCVSEMMADYYSSDWKAKRTEVVYEASTETDPPVFEPGRTHIVMVGSLTERKGVTLFGKVAELAHENQQDWQFHWIGGPPAEGFVFSPHVKWWGWRDDVLAFLQRADLLFLSSIDDPQPLAALEAGLLGKRLVCFAGTGTAELIQGLNGCSFFSDYSPVAAHHAIAEALAEQADSQAIRARVQHVAGIDRFSERLEKALRSTE